MNGRICARCGVFKEWEHFVLDSHTTTGRSSSCKPCLREYRNAKRFDLKKKGWSVELLDKCYEYQNGVCYIDGCDGPAERADHDCETGEPRSLLCHNCNVSLGLLKEDPERIRGLAKYTEQCLNARMWLS